MRTTILIVDDVQIVRKHVRAALKELMDAEFLEANDAAEGLKIASRMMKNRV